MSRPAEMAAFIASKPIGEFVRKRILDVALLSIGAINGESVNRMPDHHRKQRRDDNEIWNRRLRAILMI